jgi:hypothetical protein
MALKCVRFRLRELRESAAVPCAAGAPAGHLPTLNRPPNPPHRRSVANQAAQRAGKLQPRVDRRLQPTSRLPPQGPNAHAPAPISPLTARPSRYEEGSCPRGLWSSGRKAAGGVDLAANCEQLHWPSPTPQCYLQVRRGGPRLRRVPPRGACLQRWCPIGGSSGRAAPLLMQSASSSRLGCL